MTLDPSGNIVLFDSGAQYANYTSGFVLRSGPTTAHDIYGNGFFDSSNSFLVPAYSEGVIRKYTVFGSGSFIAGALFGGDVLSGPLGVAKGHTTDFYAATTLKTDPSFDALNRISRINSSFPSQTLFKEAVAVGGRYRGMATVLAPEPGTMLAIGSGVAALVLRKRKKS
jgi:hypothetical protein